MTELENEEGHDWYAIVMTTLGTLAVGALFMVWWLYGGLAAQAVAVLDAYMGFLRWFEVTLRPTPPQFYLVAFAGPLWPALTLVFLFKPFDRMVVKWQEHRRQKRWLARWDRKFAKQQRREAKELERVKHKEELRRKRDVAVT